jgi:hypothetical protein
LLGELVAFAFEPLPLVIGVAGHVDLRETDIPRLRTEVEAIFDRLEREYANPESHSGRMPRRVTGNADKPDGETPVIVLSTLAAGAGQLVTEVALARGLRVIAPLPLPIDAYRRDFEWDPDRPDTLMTFEAWMARPDIHKLFVGYERGNTPENVWHHGPRRNLQYRRAGAFIARYCDVLLALWDGKPDTPAGSTAEIVSFKRHGFPPGVSGSARACLDAPETGPVIHIVTPRAMKMDTAAAVSPPRWGAPAAGRERGAAAAEDIAGRDHDFPPWRSFEASVRQTRDFNRDAARLLASPRGRIEAGQSFMQLFEVDKSNPETRATALKAGTVAPRWCVSYAVADALARHWRNVVRRDWRWLSGLGLFAFACFEAFSYLAPAAQGLSGVPFAGRLADLALLSGAVAALAAVFVLYRIAIARRHWERSLDYRALAEALRVAVFWKLAGIDGGADAWPVRMPGELAWVKTCLLRQDLSDMTAPVAAARASLNGTSYDWIRRIWITGRLTSFRRTRSAYLKAAGWRERGAAAVLAAVAALAAALLVLACGDAAAPGQPARELLLFAIGVAVGVAALLAGYVEMLAFNAAARQRDRMANLFARALAVLPPALEEANLDLARNALRELGVEALRETAAWVSMRRPRSISTREE